MKDFAHLHLHTEYSLLDGACRIDKALQYAKDLGQSAIAITDHGVMYGVIDFYKKAKEIGIKPIIGCEVYVAPRSMHDKVYKIDSSPYHLILLCKNYEGYKNLISLVSKASIEGFYNKPRIDYDLLKSKSNGLICLSACLVGQIPRMLLNNDYNGAKEVALKYIEIFGKDDYYIEIQNHGIEEQQKIMPLLKKLADELGLKTVATNDCHYIHKDDSDMHHILTCISTGSTVENANLEFSTDEFYIKSREEMEEALPGFEEALDNTIEIANKCNIEFEFGNLKLPYYSAPNGMDNTEFFRKSCYEGLKKHYGDNPKKEIVDRLEYEMNVIQSMGYVDYYLIVNDFISYAKSVDIPVGPGRGSGAGSIAAYCIGITNIDPIKYNLIFERFLNPERVSMPDFDVDICYSRRQEVIDYVVRKYGEDHVSQIITFGTLAARAAVRDVGRVLGMNYQQVDKVARLIPQKIGMTIDKALDGSDEFRNAYNDNTDVKKLIDMAKKLEGMPRHASIHAAGVVISKNPVESYVPLQRGEGAAVAQFPMTTLEELGLLKMDFLGLRNLTVIDDCVKEIQKINPDFSLEKIPLDDKDVFTMFSNGLTEGVFQFESSGMKRVLMQLGPDCIEDLIAVISLYRPGPMDSIPTYIKNRHNPDLITYKEPKLKKILDVTYGCIVYQEQVMQICRELAGFSYGRADLVRRAMSKKKASVMQKERDHFINGLINDKGEVECIGCIKNGISEKVANEIFDDMSSFASYAFNKSHAAAYATLSYQTAYLKNKYPGQYMSALLSSVNGNVDKVVTYLNECRRLGFEILGPDVNESMENFTYIDGKIRFGLLAIKNVGNGVVNRIIERRKTEKFSNFKDFCKRMMDSESRHKTFESLIKCGALDCLNVSRNAMMCCMDEIISEIETDSKNNIEGQINLFDIESDTSKNDDIDINISFIKEFDKQTLLKFEKEYLGVYVSGHPLNPYINTLKNLNIKEIKDIYEDVDTFGEDSINGKNVKIAGVVSYSRKLITKKGETMYYLGIEDLTGSIETIVFPKFVSLLNQITDYDKPIVIDGRLSIQDEEASVRVENISLINENLINDKKNGKDNILYLQISSKNDEKYYKVLKILSKFEEGSDMIPVFIKYMDTNIWDKGLINVNYSKDLINELTNVIGEECVVFHRKENI